jgi:hypothetical protein
MQACRPSCFLRPKKVLWFVQAPCGEAKRRGVSKQRPRPFRSVISMRQSQPPLVKRNCHEGWPRKNQPPNGQISLLGLNPQSPEECSTRQTLCHRREYEPMRGRQTKRQTQAMRQLCITSLALETWTVMRSGLGGAPGGQRGITIEKQIRNSNLTNLTKTTIRPLPLLHRSLVEALRTNPKTCSTSQHPMAGGGATAYEQH